MKRFFINKQLAIDNWHCATGNVQSNLGKCFILLIAYCLLLIITSCNSENKEDHSQHQQTESKELYTCPMPQDSVFSDKPGKCPKCGMDLVKKEKQTKAIEGVSLNSLLKPTNEFVVATLPLVNAKQSKEPMEIDVLGYTTYNTSSVGTIAARISGRIEKLYMKYRYQKISKGQRIMDIYSPELLTAQQNLLFVLKSDKDNNSMIEAAKQKLLLLGFSAQQLQQVMQSGNPSATVAVYSNYAGHIHEAATMDNITSKATEMAIAEVQTTQELNLKEGMYVQRGQSVFSVYDPGKLWILLNIYPQDMAFVKTGDKVRIVPESQPGKDFRAAINYIEPFYRKGNKTIAARVNFDNRQLKLPIGTQVKATVFSGGHEGLWLPKEAVLSLGLDKVVFLKTDEGFKVHKIATGHMHKELLQVTAGLTEKDSVAANAQYLTDSESFVKPPSDFPR